MYIPSYCITVASNYKVKPKIIIVQKPYSSKCGQT